MGASQRRKGATGERELRNMLADFLGVDVQRNLQQTRDGGHDLLGIGPFALEVKRCEQLNLGTWWAQACDQAEQSGLVPALAYRQSRQPWRFVVPVRSIMGQPGYTYEPRATVEIDGFALIVRELIHTEDAA